MNDLNEYDVAKVGLREDEFDVPPPNSSDEEVDEDLDQVDVPPGPIPETAHAPTQAEIHEGRRTVMEAIYCWKNLRWDNTEIHRALNDATVEYTTAVDQRCRVRC